MLHNLNENHIEVTSNIAFECILVFVLYDMWNSRWSNMIKLFPDLFMVPADEVIE